MSLIGMFHFIIKATRIIKINILLSFIKNVTKQLSIIKKLKLNLESNFSYIVIKYKYFFKNVNIM